MLTEIYDYGGKSHGRYVEAVAFILGEPPPFRP